MAIAQDHKLDRIVNNYNKNDLKWCLNRALEDIKYLENYINQVKKQITIVEKTKFKPVVIFERSHNLYNGNRVEYFVKLEERPQIEGIDDTQFRDKLYIPTDCHKRFEGGAKKKAAKEYAEELAEKYGAEIEMVGF